MSDECNFLGSVSSQEKFEAMDVKALRVSQLLDSLCSSSQTDQFYLENKEKYILEAWGHADPKDVKRRENSPRPLAPLFTFFLPLSLYVNWASQECFLFYLRSSLQSSDLPLTFLCSIFMSFSLSCLLATAILNFCFLF